MEMNCLHDFEEYAKKHLDRHTWIYYSQGSEREIALRQNLLSFRKYRIIPKMLRNVPVRDLSVKVLGEKLSFPLGCAPCALQKLAHPDGELAAATAADDMDIIYTLSTVSNTPLETIARAVNRDSILWMQIYAFTERRYTENMIKKAEANGYKALVLTIDAPVKGLHLKLFRDPLKLPSHIKFCNMIEAIDPNLRDTEMDSSMVSISSTLTWDDVTWIRSISSLPLVVKGILSTDDAVRASSLGAAAVWVSNHGGRSLDGVDTAIDALPSISSALAGTGCEIYIDGGIRWGSDILKALAVGANAVFIGRPVLWGLAYSGKEGVRKVIQILKSEMDRAMHLAGCKDIQDIGPHLVKKNLGSHL